MIRLNKYLSEAGVCSRREADRLIESGIVTVDGKTAAPGMKVEDGQGDPCRKKSGQKQNGKNGPGKCTKPAGIVCTKTKGRKRTSSGSSIIRYASLMQEDWIKIRKGF